MAETNHIIQIGVHLNERLGIKSVTFDINTTELPSNSETLKRVALTILEAIALNKEMVMTQDLLNELNIKVSDK